MSKIIIPSMKERFQAFLRDLGMVESSDGVKAVARKNFPLLTRLEEKNGTIHVTLGDGIGLVVKDAPEKDSKAFEFRSNGKCLLIDKNAKRLCYKGNPYNRLVLWNSLYQRESKVKNITNLGKDSNLIQIPEISFEIKEGAGYVYT